MSFTSSTIKSMSFSNGSKNLKWPTYICQILHSSVMLGESASDVDIRIQNMLKDIPNHRFNFKNQSERIRRIEETMQHIKNKSVLSETKKLIDNVDRAW